MLRKNILKENCENLSSMINKSHININLHTDLLLFMRIIQMSEWDPVHHFTYRTSTGSCMLMSCSKSDHLHFQVSKAAADLMAYCDAHACDDPLISPVPTSENPFREKKFFCALL